MHRQALLDLIETYAIRYPSEPVSAQFREFVTNHRDCLERSCEPGHITSSAWILSPDGGAALLTHHAKLGRWLQLGGHVDGEPDVLQSALREAREESGMTRFSVLVAYGEAIDLDVHPIPARGSEPAHLHYDVRFVLRAEAGQSLMLSDESLDLRWWPRDQLREANADESVLRLERKAVALGL